MMYKNFIAVQASAWPEVPPDFRHQEESAYLPHKMALEALSVVSPTIKQRSGLFYGRARIITAFFVVSIILAITYLTTDKIKAVGSNWGRPNSVQPSIAFWKKLTSTPRSAVRYCTRCRLIRRQRSLDLQSNSAPLCPAYFQWIYEDLAPWIVTGISKNLILEGRKTNSFRVVIVNGRLFIEPHAPCFQTRAIFTVWGFAQLLSYYPGLVPDVDLLFGCGDMPVISKPSKESVPFPTFRYCSAPNFYDISFPDWSFWGWPELNIRPWSRELSDIVKGSRLINWTDRNPKAYWKGNPNVARLRKHLLKCNSTDFGAELFIQDWASETASGFNHSKLSEQCTHRYKIYVEGRAWSVSLKYILACNSPVFFINPKYHDFFIRGLVPHQSYWPIRDEKLCESVKFAVNWGNSHPQKAKLIGDAGQQFISDQVGMGHVYDYMLHLLRQYSKLLKYKPSIPRDAQEVCTESILCVSPPREKPFLQQSVIKKRSSSPPCTLVPKDPIALADAKKEKVRMERGWEENGGVEIHR